MAFNGRFAKRVNTAKNESKLQKRLKECGLTKIDAKFRGIKLQVFKILNSWENNNRKFFVIFVSQLRHAKELQNNLMLVTEQSTLDIKMYSFSQKTINEWN